MTKLNVKQEVFDTIEAFLDTAPGLENAEIEFMQSQSEMTLTVNGVHFVVSVVSADQ